jgi:hypothetical protein
VRVVAFALKNLSEQVVLSRIALSPASTAGGLRAHLGFLGAAALGATRYLGGRRR